MKRALLLVAAVACLAAGRDKRPADWVLRGGGVYTMDAARSWATAVAVRDGRILFVGSDEGAAAHIGPRTRTVNLSGRMLMPAFQDAHVHPISGGVELAQCNLNEPTTADAILAKVRSCAQDAPTTKTWIVGGGWSLAAFPDQGPTRQMLDAIVTDRPVYLTAADGHSAWVNTKALRLAGVEAGTADPKNGRIERDAGGEPTGTLRESAVDLVGKLVPPPTPEERLRGLVAAMERLNRNGVTAVQEASAGSAGQGARETLETYREAERRGLLNVRVVAALTVDPLRGAEQVDDLVRLRREYSSDHVRPTMAKMFADGVIEARTAAMLAPYLDRPDSRGEPIFPASAMNTLVERLAREGFGVHIHAIGDGAVRMSLDAFQEARERGAPVGLRHQIAHLEVIDPADIPRFRDLGVIANFQALWAHADDYVVKLTWPALGPERSRWLYPIGSVARSGATLALGSDWSVSSLNPLDAIQTALTRQVPREPKRPAMVPEEAIDLPTALAAYTIGSAYANALEKDTGSIEVGKLADLVVLDRNLFSVPADEIARQKVLLTMLEGKAVYEATELVTSKP